MTGRRAEAGGAMTGARRNFIASLVTLTLGAAYLVWALTYPEKVRAVPVLVGVVTTILCLIDVIAHSGTRIGDVIAGVLSGRAHLEAEGDLRLMREEYLAMLWMGIALASVLLLGFLAATPIYVLGYMMLHGRLGLRLGLWIAGGTTLFCWGVFEFLLDFPLYGGILFGD